MSSGLGPNQNPPASVLGSKHGKRLTQEHSRDPGRSAAGGGVESGGHIRVCLKVETAGFIQALDVRWEKARGQPRLQGDGPEPSKG